jgi:hypothetical protein
VFYIINTKWKQQKLLHCITMQSMADDGGWIMDGTRSKVSKLQAAVAPSSLIGT